MIFSFIFHTVAACKCWGNWVEPPSKFNVVCRIRTKNPRGNIPAEKLVLKWCNLLLSKKKKSPWERCSVGSRLKFRFFAAQPLTRDASKFMIFYLFATWRTFSLASLKLNGDEENEHFTGFFYVFVNFYNPRLNCRRQTSAKGNANFNVCLAGVFLQLWIKGMLFSKPFHFPARARIFASSSMNSPSMSCKQKLKAKKSLAGWLAKNVVDSVPRMNNEVLSQMAIVWGIITARD